ncbi:MAG: hypothetical protein ACI89X_001687 [Planctomycetota bacterium]|jgi:hypothetical protein
MQELQGIARLSRATHNLPQHRAPSDMASRVRQRLATHRSDAIANLNAPRWRSRAVIAAAAAVLIATAWTGGFWMGQQTQPTETAALPKVASLPEASTDADSFRIASHNVLQDLAVAPNLPQHAQQPLIAAQLAYFDLPQRARPILRASPPSSIEHRLATFVTELDAAITNKAVIDWQQWHQLAEQRGLLKRAPSKPPQLANAQPSERATTIVDRFPAELNIAERQSLADLLVLKHDRLTGEVTTSLDLIKRWQNEQAKTSTFNLATGTESTRTLFEAGRPDDAKRMFRMMRTQVRMGSRAARVEHGGVTDIALRNSAEEMLNEMMRELGIPPRPGGH